MRRFIAALGTLALTLSILVSTSAAASATEQPVQTCTPGPVGTYTTQVNNRPDSGLHGNWAADSFTRTTVVVDNCDGTYVLKIKDSGRFTTKANALSPGAGLPLPAPFTGKFVGGATVKVTSATPPHPPTGGTDGSVSTSDWAKLIFDAPQATLSDWGWTYTYCGEKWVNAQGGNSGDVTGLLCVVPTVKLIATPTDCTATGPAAVLLKITTVTPTPHQPVSIPYVTNDKQRTGTVKLGKKDAEISATVAFDEDAGIGGKAVLTFGEGQTAVTVKVNTNCVIPTKTPLPNPTTKPTAPTTTTTAPTSTTSSTRAVAPVRKAGNGTSYKSEDLAYTGTSGVGVLIGIAALMLLGGAAALIVVRRRTRTHD